MRGVLSKSYTSNKKFLFPDYINELPNNLFPPLSFPSIEY